MSTNVIYKIRNLLNGKFYVGSAQDTRTRFRQHRRLLRKGAHHCKHLQNAWNKYGEELFKFEVIEHVGSTEGLEAAEDVWLRQHVGKSHCYNSGRSAKAPWRGCAPEEHPNFGKNLQKQHQLKTYFEHIDDSLFVLSMRVPSISSKIQDHLAQAHYNLDQSLENFADNYFQNGISNQQYVMTSANTLADMLSNTLDAMQNPKPGNGKGKGKGKSFSLPDIIQKQNELIEKMKQGMQKKKQGKPKDGKNGKKKGEKEGQNGEQSDDLDDELYQIYKEQSQLREQLENAIKEGNGGNGNAKKALKEMEQLENEILEKGFTQESINRMQQLNYELLKLDKATFEQNKDKQRKSNTNLQEFNNNTTKELKFKKLFYNQTEILNRQSLPLRQNYKKKVQDYFSLPKDKK